MSLFKVMVEYVNRQSMISKLIRNLYFSEIPKDDQLVTSSVNSKSIHFGFKVKMTNFRGNVRYAFDNVFCRKKNKIFNEPNGQVDKEAALFLNG